MTNLRIIKIISKKEMQYLLHEKTFFLLLTVFIIMASLSTFIGWSTQHTITSAYTVAAQILLNAGQSVPSSPLQHIQPLGIIKNMIIYVVLIGSLLSIILGYFIGINDRISGTMRLIFSRQVTKEDLLLGKVAAGFLVLTMITSASFVISIISTAIFHTLDAVSFIRMLGFYGISLSYMMGFMFVSLSLAVLMKSSAKAILYALFIWIIITFALPELGSALYPTSSLNPVLPPTTVLDSSLLAHIHNVVYPFSISGHFKILSNNILGTNTISLVKQSTTYPYYMNILILFLWNIFGLIISFVSFKKISIINSDIYE